MCAADALSSHQATVWLVVADGKSIRAYDCRFVDKFVPMSGTTKKPYMKEAFAWELVPLPEMSQDAERPPEHQTTFDQLSNSRGGPTPIHRVSTHPDLSQRSESRFMEKVAADLHQANLKAKFKHLVLAAPPRALGVLRDHLTPAVRKRVAAELPKELSHCGSDELLEHIKPIVRSLHVPTTTEIF